MVRRLAAFFIQQVFSGKRVLYICGMRRSGNHAFVDWLTNAIEARKVTYKIEKEFYPFRISDSGDTVFLNEVNMISGKEYLKILMKRFRRIRACKTVIISAEDVAPNYNNFRIPNPVYSIYVERSLLNLIASRLHNLKRYAADGIGWSRQNVDLIFFNRIKSWRDPSGFQVWKYDEWLKSPSYRKEFLKSLDLEHDLVPGLSTDGGGSSITEKTKTPVPKEAMTRYNQVEFPKWIVEQLLSDGIRELLSPTELEFLNQKTASETDGST
ncbi:MAG: hypothetical protein O7C75_08105 [Verrucomicrobia bacterium]|nr:hypothetical protein [Verrucomicrobiota bacterium]